LSKVGITRHKKKGYAEKSSLNTSHIINKVGIRHKKWEKVVLQIIIYFILNLRNFIEKKVPYAYFSKIPFVYTVFSSA
jgi:hypothetical protein